VSWTNPPTKITEARDRLLECATIQAILTGLTTQQKQDRFHYPEADPVSDTMPFFVMCREQEDYSLLTSGGSTGSGQIEWVLYADDSVNTGTLEGYMSVAKELVELVTEGLYVIRATVKRASRPTPSMQATDDGGQVETGKSFATIAGMMDWEG
jgi:hypothetical protein